jgi:hypothetical protein
LASTRGSGQEDEDWANVDIDLPIKDLFSETLSDAAFHLAAFVFQFHHAITIQDEFFDWELSIRHFLTRVATLPKMSREEYGEALRKTITSAKLSAEVIGYRRS